MNIKYRTKQMFADKLQEMATQKSIHDIQIKELCEACDVERTTFYYHFRDKYDLVAWIFAQYYNEEASQSSKLNDEDMICKMLYRIKRHRAFFLNALQDHSQNNLRQYMLDFYIDYERNIICHYLNTDILDEETEYSIRHYSFGCMGHTIDWLTGKSDLSPEKMAHFQYLFMPDILKEAIEKSSRNHG